MHKVSNKLLMAIGAASYTIAFLLLAVNKSTISYWALMFPAFVLVVIGADFEFCVVNVRTSFLPL
jgi:nitrate/nitrite transporter NarK